MTGKLTISIDLELAWGVWDTITPERLRLAEEAERPIAAALIALFDRHAIPATWAMVAALLDETSAHARPGAKSCWFAPDVVERLVAAKTRHEIGTHSGRHIYFDRIGAAEAEDDLGFARTIHRENGLSFTSMVFPRNEVGHLKQLAGVGLRTFRGPDAGPATAIRRVSEPLGQAANLAGKALPLPPPVVAAKRSGGMIDVPGSMLLMARNGVRRLVLPFVTRAKLKSGLERARRSGGIFHFWFHPSNFYYRPEEQLATLDWFLGHAANEAGQGRIEISTMGSYADRKASDQGMDAKR
jgi:peptidoglycan/xylan/chitin deacetylase (PgdA/CDA1 family)